MGVVISKRAHRGPELFKRWAYYIGRGRTMAVVVALISGFGAYGLGHLLSGQRAAPVPVAPKISVSDGVLRNKLEASARRIALAWAAAKVDRDVRGPEDLVGSYLAKLPEVPGIEGKGYPWVMDGYALRMLNAPEKLCQVANADGQPYSAERRKAGLQCHYTGQETRVLTYRLDPVPDEDIRYYQAVLTISTKNRIPVAQLEIPEATAATCDGESSLSGQVQVPPAEDKTLLETAVCIPALAWEKLSYKAGAVVLDMPEQFTTTLRSGEAARTLTASVVPVGKTAASLAWSLALKAEK